MRSTILKLSLIKCPVLWLGFLKVFNHISACWLDGSDQTGNYKTHFLSLMALPNNFRWWEAFMPVCNDSAPWWCIQLRLCTVFHLLQPCCSGQQWYLRLNFNWINLKLKQHWLAVDNSAMNYVILTLECQLNPYCPKFCLWKKDPYSQS